MPRTKFDRRYQSLKSVFKDWVFIFRKKVKRTKSGIGLTSTVRQLSAGKKGR